MKTIIIYYPDRSTSDDSTIENGLFCRSDRFTAEQLEEEFNLKLICFIPLEVKGKTYAKRKNDLRDKAIEWSYGAGLSNWSYGELEEIQMFFEEQGKRYGLIREFRENGII